MDLTIQDKAINALGINTDGYDRDGLRAVANLGVKCEYDPSDDLCTSLKDH